MHPFEYVAITKQGEAIESLAKNSAACYLAGGTNLIDEMKINVQTPKQLVDIHALPLTRVEEVQGGGLHVGAMVRNSDLAWNDLVRSRYPVLSEALLSGASPQLRNMASTGGNLLQHTRCYYFRDTSAPCNMREPGSGCSAIPGYNRIHAILGTSDKCIATHPSDMCVAMAALDAVIHITGKNGERAIPINEFYVPYGDDPAKLNVLEHGDLITAVELPALPWAKRSHYLKVRDRASYEFALASAAIVLDLDGQTIRSARVALGGIATKPWRSTEAEKALVGKSATAETYRSAADAALQGAKPQKFNAFKVELAKRTIIRALSETAALSI
jgi:xanthine dehydrogenase YagS FAD-binding subunit